MKGIQQITKQVSILWNGWEVRSLILLSLLLQIVLILFGSLRKYKKSIWIRTVVWVAYMSADPVATFALGNLAKIQVDSNSKSPKPVDIIQTFWAPFLLLHLGGPDTITAYSLEDNELWLRHLLGLLVQLVVASYVIFWSWSTTALKFLAIPILISGAIKYGERTYALRAASTEQFKDSLVPTNTFAEDAVRIIMGINKEGFFEDKIQREGARGKQEVQHYVDEANYLFKRFVYLFAGLTLGLNERIDCYNVIHQKKAEDAFKLVAIELGFMYDKLYTKATVIYSKFGIFLRIFIFVTSVSTLVVFSIVTHVHDYPDPTDISITYLLLGGAIFLEVYALAKLLLSDWTNLWLFKRQTNQINPIPSASVRFHSDLIDCKRSSVSVAQFNLISYCLEEIQGRWFGVSKLPCMKKVLKEYPYLTWKVVNADLQEVIFKQLQEKGKTIIDSYTVKSCKELLAYRGEYVLKKEIYNLGDKFNWSTVDIEFDHSLLVWHIATDICYCDDFDEKKKMEEDVLKQRKISKCLSDYMLYLLVQCPTMFPEGIGEIRYRDTCAQVRQFFETTTRENKKIEFCKKLLGSIGRMPVDQSVLSDACKLAKELQSLESDPKKLSRADKWRMISEVWVELLIYAASHCGWKEHAQQLWKGGELLTHVSLLMTNLGLSERYTEKERLRFI